MAASIPVTSLRQGSRAFNPRLWRPRQRFAAVSVALAMVGIAFAQLSGSGAPPDIPAVALSSDPLYATTSGDKPTIALALSVEYPTVGAQYVRGKNNTTDDSYDPANEYLGYYDAEACYVYNDAPSETPATGLNASDYKRFQRQGASAQHRCTDAFSGNFLNWASNSAVDMLRLALSGGDRYIDEEGLTILQRAVIPNGDPVCMWNSTNFPAKQLKRDGGGAGAYWGAVPRAMATAAGTNDIWVANTLDRIYFGTRRTGACTDTAAYTLGYNMPLGVQRLNSDGYFYSRVKVCDQDDGGALIDIRDYGLCTRYPNGKYKPIGAIQKYSHTLRLAAFGYALEQTASYNNGRYGGVLRAPMKYVGPKTFDEYGQLNTPAGGNPAAEWDPQTGVLRLDPDKNATYRVSGVINYLNKFGRTGTKGVYKRYDPVGELYYESLRYLQGLPPSPDAIKGLTAPMFDGFPIYSDWSALDPFKNRPRDGNYACLKSNIVVIGDIHTHDGGYGRLPQPPASATNIPSYRLAANLPDFQAWTDVVKAFENGSVAEYSDGQGVKRKTGNPNATNPAPPGNEIVGMSYWAHTHDIRGATWTDAPDKQRPGLRVKTFVFDVNEYGEETDAAHRQFQNQFFTAAKYGGFETAKDTRNPAPYNPWGNPFLNADGSADNNVWQDPTRPGEAATYFLQSGARSVLAAFDNIFRRAGTPASSIAGVAAQSQSLMPGGGNAVYQAAFDTTNWSGDLVARSLRLDDQNAALLTPFWSAADQLAKRKDPNGSRNIVIGRAGATSQPRASAFEWDALGKPVQDELDRADPQSASDNLGQDRVKFLRGDTSKDGTTFRFRGGKLLGDIVNSGAVYSGAPPASISSASYAAFREKNLQRTAAVFVGANDGMLHAFNAGTGDELFGYIPSWMAPRLSALTAKDYVNNHQSYVDATPVVGEAQFGVANTADDWKTVLVGGTGAGGRGVYALDVTDPARFSAGKSVLWEFTPDDDPDRDMGYVIGRPQLLRFRTSAPGVAATYKWFAVVAGGVNSHVPDATGKFGKGTPALYLLDLAKAPDAAWSAGDNYFKITFPIDSALSATRATGIVNFRATLGAQQEVTRLYAGDLHGNMWKLDFEPLGKDDWTLGKLSPFSTGATPRPIPLFIARDATGTVQPVTSAPQLVRGAGRDDVIVVFGTGKYLDAGDRSSTASNSVYAIYDDGKSEADSKSPKSAVNGRSRLASGAFDAATGKIAVSAFTWGRPKTDGDKTQRAGWYFDLAAPGERQVSGIRLAGDTLLFSSLIPNTTAATSICGAEGGSGRSYEVSVDSGSGTSRVSQVGVLGESLVLDLSSATEWTSSDSTGRRVRTTVRQVFEQGSSGVGVGSTVRQTQVAGRLSWRQVHNYLDLKNAP